MTLVAALIVGALFGSIVTGVLLYIKAGRTLRRSDRERRQH